MSKENYEALLPEIEAIPDAATLVPHMPVDKYVQEALDLQVWCQEDIPVLLQAGVAQPVFDSLAARTGALRYAQSLWKKERYTKAEATQEWDTKEPIANDLRDELEHTFRFAFRARPDLLSKVQQIEEGTGKEDLVQDLSDLAVLGTANLPLLESIQFDVAKLDTAAQMSTDLGDLLAISNGARTEGNSGKVLRDKAYTYLKQSVDEIRAAGKFAFWKSPQRLKGYYSRYLNKNR